MALFAAPFILAAAALQYRMLRRVIASPTTAAGYTAVAVVLMAALTGRLHFLLRPLELGYPTWLIVSPLISSLVVTLLILWPLRKVLGRKAAVSNAPPSQPRSPDPIVFHAEHPNGRHRAEVFRRDNGTFGFREYYWHDLADDWALCGDNSEMWTDTLERAVSEVRARLPWLRDLPDNESGRSNGEL